MPEETRLLVQQFYYSSDISRILPTKKDVTTTKDGDEEIHLYRHMMEATQQEAYRIFISQNEGIKIGQRSFDKLKPPDVKRMNESLRIVCLCTTCRNVSLKVDAWNKFVSTHDDA